MSIDEAAAAEKLFGETTKPPPAPQAPADGAKSQAQSPGDGGKSRAERMFPGELRDLIGGDPDKDGTDGTDDEKPEGDKSEGADPLDGLDFDESFAAAGELREVATELGLDSEAVQRLAEVELNHRQEFWERTSDRWRAEIKADASIDLVGARSVLRRFADDKFMTDIEKYRMGDNPGFARFLSRVAAEIGG